MDKSGYIIFIYIIVNFMMFVIVSGNTSEKHGAYICVENKTCSIPNILGKRKITSIDFEFWAPTGEKEQLAHYINQGLTMKTQHRFYDRLVIEIVKEEEVKFTIAATYNNDTGKFVNKFTLPDGSKIDTYLTITVSDKEPPTQTINVYSGGDDSGVGNGIKNVFSMVPRILVLVLLLQLCLNQEF